MAVALGQGQPTYTAVTIPVLYPKKLQVKFYAKTVITNICSTEYEGELKKQGDKARIRIKPTVNRKTGALGQDMVSETPAFTYVDLDIDKIFYYNILCPNVAQSMSDIDLMAEYEEAIISDNGVQTDADVLAYFDSLGDASNIGATAGVKTSSYDLGATGASIPITELNAPDKIADMIYSLKERNIDEDFWILIPQWYTRKLVTSELKAANEMGDAASTMRSGLVGKLFGHELYESNNMTSTTDGTDSNVCWWANAGHKSAIAFAQVVQNFRIIDAEMQFAKRIQLEVVYGRKVVQDDYLTGLYCRPAV